MFLKAKQKQHHPPHTHTQTHTHSTQDYQGTQLYQNIVIKILENKFFMNTPDNRL